MAENSEFIVSARKYRPQTFRSVVGQRHITETLRNAIAKGQMAHAYLFTGPRGVGKTTCARIFARAINCLNPTSEFEACGECESCVAFAADRSFNIHEMDAASNNSVDDIRALNDKVRVAPQIGQYSVYIIDEVHMLSASAFNAFLKTLEEPPHHAIFVLATTEKHKILPTILSRCQIYDFNRIRVEDIVDYLQYIAAQEGVTYDEESLAIIARGADGGMRDALSTFDRVVSFCGSELRYGEVGECVGALDYNTYFSVVDMALAGDYASLLVLFDTILSKGFDGQHFLSGLAEHLRGLLVAKNPSTVKLLELSGSVSQRYVAQSAAMEVPFLFSAINLVSAADSSYRNATSRRLHIELMLMKFAGLNSSLTGVSPQIVRAVLPKISSDTTASGRGDTQPTAQAVAQPTAQAVAQPTAQAAVQPTAQAVAQPTAQAAVQPIVQPAVQPTAQAVAQPIVQPAAQPTAQAVAQPTAQPAAQPTPQPGANPSGSMLGFSISSLNKEKEAGADTQKKTSDVIAVTPQEGLEILKARFSELVNLWQNRNRPRIALVLSTAVIDSDHITVFVQGDIMADEITNSMIDIEGDMMRLFNYRLPIEIILSEDNAPKRPVTLQQRVDHLVAKNSEVLNLTSALDLTM
ncbi:MAG: DNA polymerase III subunit gamma/tau [Rikenellaceae bacterium]